MDLPQNLLMNAKIKIMKTNTLLLILLAMGIGVSSSCRKARVLGKLNGEWDAVYYKIDGVEQDISGEIFIDFNGAYQSGVFRNAAPGGGYYNATFFDHTYDPKEKELVLYFDTGLIERIKIKKIKALGGALSYSDEETAPEQYMILEKNNEEFKFVKRFED